MNVLVSSVTASLVLASMCHAIPLEARTFPYAVDTVVPLTAGSGEARAVNARGDIAGQVDGDAFIWYGGRLHRYRDSVYQVPTGTPLTIATAIDANGRGAGSVGTYLPCSMSGLELATVVCFEKSTSLVDGQREMVCTFEIDGMNDAGVLVGETGYRGFVRYRDGREISILPLSTRPEYNGTRASAIDNEGHVVGATTIDVTHICQIPMGSQQRAGGPVETINGPNRDDFLIHALLATFTGGKQHMHDLGGLGGASTYATALNEDLTVVGYSGRRLGAKWSRVSQEGHAWVWQRGRMTNLGALKKANSIAYGVNDASVIVGCSGDDAVRWVNKRIENLNHLIDPRSGWHLACARAINRAGIIVGVGTNGGARLPFRLIPIR